MARIWLHLVALLWCTIGPPPCALISTGSRSHLSIGFIGVKLSTFLHGGCSANSFIWSGSWSCWDGSFHLQSLSAVDQPVAHVHIPLEVLETADRLFVNAGELFNNAVGGRRCVSYNYKHQFEFFLFLRLRRRWSSFPCLSSPSVLFPVTSPFVAHAVTTSKFQVLNFYLKILIFMHSLSFLLEW